MWFLITLGLELYALTLAGVESLGGVRTDEAKYLLNIPYPHPPLVRWLLGQTTQWPYQEFFWRIVFATVLVQAMWFVWDLSRGRSPRQRAMLCGMWLAASALILQAGSIMMAPLTAVEGLVFLWLLSKVQLPPKAAGWIALLWLASLFTAYQAILYFPMAVALLWNLPIRRTHRVLLIGVPVLLLGLYTFTNPLALASIAIKGGQTTDHTIIDKFGDFVAVWMMAGSFIISILGTVGIVRSRRWELIATLVLVSLYIGIARFDYNAILLLPLLIVGMLFYRAPWVYPLTLAGEAVLSVIILVQAPPALHPTVARGVIGAIVRQHQVGYVLISGPFGHEWEYESPFIVKRYSQAFLLRAQAVVCLDGCVGVIIPQGWTSISGAPVTVLEKRG